MYHTPTTTLDFMMADDTQLNSTEQGLTTEQAMNLVLEVSAQPDFFF